MTHLYTEVPGGDRTKCDKWCKITGGEFGKVVLEEKKRTKCGFRGVIRRRVEKVTEESNGDDGIA